MAGDPEDRRMSAASGASMASSMTIRAEGPFTADRKRSYPEDDFEDGAGTGIGDIQQ